LLRLRASEQVGRSDGKAFDDGGTQIIVGVFLERELDFGQAQHGVYPWGRIRAAYFSAAGGATALLPIYACDILHTGPEGLGLLRATPPAGAVFSPPLRLNCVFR
jgi:hypothetical protein